MLSYKISGIINSLQEKELGDFFFSKTTLIIIHHLLPTHIDFFVSLSSFFSKTILIAIPYSINFEAKKSLENTHDILVETPASIEQVLAILDNAICIEAPKQKIVIIEVGGYSTSILPQKESDLKSKILCVIEDTEYGLRLHENCLKNKSMWWPLFSVARSPLKLPEDNLTADAILYSLEKIIRSSFNVLVAKNVLVIGFGKIGKGICHSLKNRKNNVYVYDNNPIKLIEAYSAGYQIKPKEELLEIADIIIGATGNESLRQDDFERLKDGVVLCSASSKKVEFDINYLEIKMISKEKVQDALEVYKLAGNKNIFLVNAGTPVNFIDLGIIGNVLHLVWLEIIYCLFEISLTKISKGIHELEAKKRVAIAKIWLSHYNQLIE